MSLPKFNDKFSILVVKISVITSHWDNLYKFSGDLVSEVSVDYINRNDQSA